MLTTRSLPALSIGLLLALAGCAGAAVPSPTPAPTPRPTPTAVPGGPSIDPGAGVIGGPGIIVNDPNGDPLLGQAKFVTPASGLINQHNVNVQLIRALADGQGVRAEVRWWSGVEPCSVLDSIKVNRDEAARTIKLTVVEGSGPGDVACIDIAQLKAAVVNLGVLAAGTWTISAEGDAAPFKLQVA
jgi:hypothetical protein